MTSDNLIPSAECAATIHMKPNSFLRAVRNGTIKVSTVQVGKQVLVVRSSFENLLADKLVLRQT